MSKSSHQFTKAEKATYDRKIVSREKLKEILGARPRKKKVIMCHGTFDLVHPGHVRHLIYAKSKASILVASLTADRWIEKAHYRPFVPQDLRAMNLAALEMVDYVIIDENETPIENLLFLQPDYFAKGYEYSKEGVHPKTQKEIDALDTYGGEVLFTPGDIVYSSSFIIENNPPNLAADKLHMLLDSQGIEFTKLDETLRSLEGVKVHVIGDMIVDSYTYCSLIGGNTKTPTFSLKFGHQVDYVGGAGVVAKHMKKAGADVTLTTMLGEDPLKDFVLEDLKQAGVKVNAITSSTRPTTQKNLFSVQNYKMIKVDKLDNRPITDKTLDRFVEAIRDTPTEAVVFSDFRHGIFSAGTIPVLIEAIPKGVLKVADSQVASRWGNILEFKGFDLITPNEREARFSLGDQDSTVRPLALELYKRAECKYLIMKMGEKGVMTYIAPSPEVRSFFTVDSFAENVIDAVGAGDALLAYGTLVLAKTGNPVLATIIGSMAAAVTCEHDGNNPVEPSQVRAKIDKVSKLVHFE